ncbi:MAG: thymidine phosphorylase [Candidatus Pacearchaeota archaeon]|nr:thymidine phosphorylase [Candidatus Pacearchaeota archaeon]
MKLKIKLMKWAAGLPVVMIDKKTAQELGVHTKDRLLIKTLSRPYKKLSTIVDVVEGLVSKDQLGVSLELKGILGLKVGQYVDVILSPTPKSMFLIKKKLDKERLTQKEINNIIEDIVSNSLSETETALFVAAMYENGMNVKETIFLIKAILKTGNILDFDGKRSSLVVDKHCIGGIPANRTTPVVVSICVCAGLIMPKSSSRAITSAAGTADVIETIAKVDFSVKEIKKIVSKTNACMVWGGGLGMVPADSKIIKVEKLLKIDPKAQLLASIMSKKLALGAKYILIDIPYGKNAKVSKEKALELKRDFERLGKYFRKKIKVVLTKGDEPIGDGVGPALELIDVIRVLDPNKNGPLDLKEKSIFLAGEILELTKKAKKGKGEILAKEILESGKAFEKFKEIIKAQRGSLSKIKIAKFSKNIKAHKSGKIKEIHNKKINSLARVAGCPVDKASGIFLYCHLRDKVKKGDKLMTIYSESESRLKEAIKYYKEKKPVIIHN